MSDVPIVNAIHIVHPEYHLKDGKSVNNGNELYTLHVENLSFKPYRTIFHRSWEYANYKALEYNAQWIIPSLHDPRRFSNLAAPLHRIHFEAVGGELVVCLGDVFQRRTLTLLLSGRKKIGTFDGDIRFSGPGLKSTDYYYDHMAYVQREPLYISGLTFLEMLRFSAQLKIKPSPNMSTSKLVEERVQELIDLMNLASCKNAKIPFYTAARGELGGDLRRLSIALEVVDLPPLIVIDEPTLELDTAISMNIMHCVHRLCKKGHIVYCSMSRAFAQEMELVDRIVLLSEGFTIYTGPSKNVRAFFTSSNMGYDIKAGIDIFDFLLDVSSGVERPAYQRQAELPEIMQRKYEESDYFERVPAHEVLISAFSPEFFFLLGYGRLGDPIHQWNKLVTVIYRAVYTKLRDVPALVGFLLSPLLLGMIYGYMNYQTGGFGDYSLQLLGVPYAQTTNCAGLFFFITAACWALPFIYCDLILKKIELFRYEQDSNCCSTFAFYLAFIFSEIPIAVVGCVIIASLLYGFTGMGTNVGDYNYFASVIICMGLLGTCGAWLFCALLRRELLIRDSLFVMLTLCIFLSGYPFLFSNMPSYFADAAGVNPVRWAFEGLMKWKFSKYVDGNQFLVTYGFQDFDHKKLHEIMINFVVITVAILAAALIKEPLLLQRRNGVSSADAKSLAMSTDFSRDSEGEIPKGKFDGDLVPRRSTRQSESVKPVLFMRESSVTGHNSKHSINVSQTGEHNTNRGPTVTFADVSVRVKDSRIPGGYKNILSRVSGQFDWGKLSCVMGSSASGKSTLLHALAGDFSLGSEVEGVIKFDGEFADPLIPLWQRCGFVPQLNEQMQDLTVYEVVKFAMLLRCFNSLGLSVVEENVNTTLANLHLEDLKTRKVHTLNSGELKRLSIAEEVVHGPKLLLLDEPTTDVSPVEQSILMMTFREMVNDDRTVIASIHQPSAEVFRLFDSLILLSRGRVIYFGSIGGSAMFFTSSPFAYNMSSYSNPADFLADISGGFISDGKGEFVDPSVLENYYMQTDAYSRLVSRYEFKRDSQSTATANPIRGSGGDSGGKEGNIGISSTDEEAAGGSDVGGRLLTKKISPPLALLVLALPFQELYSMLATRDARTTSLFKGSVIFRRSFNALFGRLTMISQSNLMHILLAVLFGWIMGKCTEATTVSSVAALFALSNVFLILLNVIFVYYLFNNHGVFLKESARNLYPSSLYWMVTDFPLYFLRAFNAIIFILIVWGMIDLDTSTSKLGFAVLMYVIFAVTTINFTLAILGSAGSKREIYGKLAGFAGFNMIFSTLLVKPSTMPAWLAAFTPSISAVRWVMQGNFISYYNGSDLFVVLPSGYSTYTALLNLYGWGGKTRWYCVYCLLGFFVAFKLITLFTNARGVLQRRGGGFQRSSE